MKSTQVFIILKSELEKKLDENIYNEISQDDILWYIEENEDRLDISMFDIPLIHRMLVRYFKKNYSDKYITLN